MFGQCNVCGRHANRNLGRFCGRNCAYFRCTRREVRFQTSLPLPLRLNKSCLHVECKGLLRATKFQFYLLCLHSRQLVDDVRHPVTSICLSNDGNCTVASCLDSTVRLLDRLAHLLSVRVTSDGNAVVILHVER